MSAPGDTTPLEADLAALRKLRDDETTRRPTTRVAEDDVDAKLAERAKQRLQEKIVGLEDLESKRALGEESGPASRGEDSELPQTGVRKNTDGAADTTPASSQERSADVKEALMNAQELLAKANGGTCSGNSCHCVVA